LKGFFPPGILCPHIPFGEGPATIPLNITNSVIKDIFLLVDRDEAIDPVTHAEYTVDTFYKRNIPERAHDVIPYV
jgi:hypothetical protein